MSANELVHTIGCISAVFSAALTVVPVFMLSGGDERGGAFVLGTILAGGSSWLAWALLYWVHP